MASFCRQCCREIFGDEGMTDFNFGDEVVGEPLHHNHVLCEGCGELDNPEVGKDCTTIVSNTGRCIWENCPQHKDLMYGR